MSPEPLWSQNYDPLGNPFLSTLLAALPIAVLLGSIALLNIRIHFAALLGLLTALAVALAVQKMPAPTAFAASLYGAAFGLFPIGWIILNVLFLYQLTVDRGLFETLRISLANLAPDARIQLILIAFAFGAFIEGMAGFGTPVAITAALLIQLGFTPLHASGLALIANTAPVAFGSLGIPITTLEQVTGLDLLQVSAMVGRQLPFFSLLIPFWIVTAYSGWRSALQIWPAALVAGSAFAIPQALISNLHGPWLVDIISGAASIGATLVLLKFWKPKSSLTLQAPSIPTHSNSSQRPPLLLAWMPWILLTACILLWGLPQTQKHLNQLFLLKIPIPHLHGIVQRVAPVVPMGSPPESAEFKLNLLSATGTGILAAALLVSALLRIPIRSVAQTYLQTLWKIRYSLLTIATMLALGNVTKFSGTDATLGLALSQTGPLYPFFGTLLGWLGVALTGSDTAANVLFGSLQTITAKQLNLSPVLMGAANSAGGVMGKMIDAQSIVVASTATQWYGKEASILRFVFWHSLTLACLLGLFVLLQAYVYPFTLLRIG